MTLAALHARFLQHCAVETGLQSDDHRHLAQQLPDIPPFSSVSVGSFRKKPAPLPPPSMRSDFFPA